MNAASLPSSASADNPTDRETDRHITALLGVPHCADGLSAMNADQFTRRAVHHGVSTLLADVVADVAACPATIRQALRKQAIAEWLWHVDHEQVLRKALAALAAAGARPIVFKGSALCYSHYPHPAARARADSDVLVPPESGPAALDALLQSGFQAILSVTGEMVSTQRSLQLRLHDVPHTIDLHWRFSNSAVLSGLLSHEELACSTIHIDALGVHARAPSAPYALLIAIVHRAAHRTQPIYDGNQAVSAAERLVWLYDVDLLVRALHPGEREQFIQLARRARDVCVEALTSASATFGSSTELLEAVREIPASQDRVSAYLQAGRIRQWWLDFGQLGTPRQQIRFMRELLLPDSRYMRSRYPAGPALPVLYAMRAVRGIAKAFRPPHA
jgi:hypothetical protein